MFERKTAILGAVIAAGALASTPAYAQKAKDTLRIAISGPIASVVEWLDPQPETGLSSTSIFDAMVCYDHKTYDFKPLLAKSWKQVDDKTLEFTLRDDVKFHDGSEVTADDVVFTLNWLRDPNNKLRLASDAFTYVAKVEKVDRLTVRIVATEPTAPLLLRMAISLPIYPAKIVEKFEDRTEFGRKSPIGTGPYKVVSVDAKAGIVLVKNDAYKHGNDCKPAAKIGRVEITTIPDMQTQVAQMMTGGIDLIHGPSKDEADALAANPLFKMTASQGITFFYLSIDSINRSGAAPLQNLKVRQAIARGLNRELVARSVVAGGEVVKAIDAMCLPNQQGCDYSTKPPAYDLAAAKALLTEAGYPDGFDVEITAIPGSYAMAEAIAGELRKINIRARVDKASFPAYRQKQRDNKTNMIAGQWTLGGLPDVSSTTNFFFDNAARDYWRDAQITQWAKEGLSTIDPAKRKAIYRRIFDRINELTYMLPISTSPDIFVHTKDLYVEQGATETFGANIYEMRWN